MATVLEQAVSIGTEATYGADATPTVAYEATSDEWRQLIIRSEQGGYTRGQHAELVTSDRPIRIGAAGTIGMNLIDDGLLPLYSHLWNLETTGVTRVEVPGKQYRRLFTDPVNGPNGSLTVDMYRVLSRSGDGSVWRYGGAVATGYTIDVAPGGPVTMTVSFDAASEFLAAGSVAPPYAAGNPYTWDDVSVTLEPPGGGSAVLDGIRSFTFQARLGMRRPDDGRRLGATGRSRPRRLELPAFRGALEGVPRDLAEYLRWEADAPFQLSLRCTRRYDGFRRQFLFLMHDTKYDEARYRSHPNRLTALNLPFKVYEAPGAEPWPVRVIVRDSTPLT